MTEPGAGLPAEWLLVHLAKCRYCTAVYAEFTRARSEFLAPTPPDADDRETIAMAMEIPAGKVVVPTLAPPERRRRGFVAAAVAAGFVLGAAATAIWMQSKPTVPATASYAFAGLLYSAQHVPTSTGLRGTFETTDLEALRRAYEAKPTPGVAFDLIAGFLAAERFRDAEPFLREALQRFPGESRFHNLAAILAYQNSDLTRSESELRTALKIDDASYLLVNLATVLLEQGRTPEAETLLARVMERNPAAPIAALARARAAAAKRERSEP